MKTYTLKFDGAEVKVRNFGSCSYHYHQALDQAQAILDSNSSIASVQVCTTKTWKSNGRIQTVVLATITRP